MVKSVCPKQFCGVCIPSPQSVLAFKQYHHYLILLFGKFQRLHSSIISLFSFHWGSPWAPMNWLTVYEVLQNNAKDYIVEFTTEPLISSWFLDLIDFLVSSPTPEEFRTKLCTKGLCQSFSSEGSSPKGIPVLFFPILRTIPWPNSLQLFWWNSHCRPSFTLFSGGGHDKSQFNMTLWETVSTVGTCCQCVNAHVAPQIGSV